MYQLFIINSGLRFILEIVSIIVLLWIGFTKFEFPLNYILGIISPVFFILLWGIFIAPASSYRANHLARFIIEILIFNTISYLIIIKSNRIFGINYLIFSLINTLLNHLVEFQLNTKKLEFKKHL